MSADHESSIANPELLHGINFIGFLKNINKRAFAENGEITRSSRYGVQKYDFDLNGQTLISIQSDEDKIVVSSGIGSKYTVTIDPNFNPRRDSDPESQGLDIKYVLRSVIVEGLFPGRKNRDQKAEMLKAISDETDESDISSENPEPKFCTIKLTYFPFNKE